jgi:twitching motility protein PilT
MAVSDGMLSPLEKFLVTLATKEGDDLLLAANRQPYLKKLGKMVPLADRTLTEGQVQALVLPLLSGAQLQELKAMRDIDMSYEVPSHDLRFRVNIFNQRSGLCAVFRIVKGELPELEKLGLPAAIYGTVELKNGLVLMGGPTGSGKSTTLAAIIHRINQTQARHIISLEDPIEVRHDSDVALVNQREVGTHARSYALALRSTLRQDPDVILIGELRDLPTISFAVSAAETGHLVFGTVHTVSAETSMDRLINTFPAGQQDQVRSMLAESLRLVLCQYLLQRKDQPGRILACEVMFNNDAISNLIRKGNSYQIPSIIATSRESGMQLMDQDLMRLYKEGKVHAEEVYMKANTKKDFEFLVGEGPMPGVDEAATPKAASPDQATVLGEGGGPAATGAGGATGAEGATAAAGATGTAAATGAPGSPGAADPKRGAAGAPQPAASGPGARGVMDRQVAARRPRGDKGGRGGQGGAPPASG